MSHDERRIAVADGKYTFFVPEGDWRPHVLRYGESWHVVEEGCNAVTSLMSELIDAREVVDAVRSWSTSDETAIPTLKAKRTDENLIAAFRTYQSKRGEQVTRDINWLRKIESLAEGDDCEVRNNNTGEWVRGVVVSNMPVSGAWVVDVNGSKWSRHIEQVRCVGQTDAWPSLNRSKP